MSSEEQSVTKTLQPIVDEYIVWYGEVFSALQMPDRERQINTAGSVLRNFLESLNNDHFITRDRSEEILFYHQEMLGAYEHLLLGQSLEQTHFKEKFESFIHALRQLERDCVLEDHGLDYLTGLRSKAVLYKDLTKELEKLSRKGKPFTIALIVIDSHDEIIRTLKEEASLPFTRKVAEILRRAIRNFDEAYRSGPGEFVLLLKQSEISGGLAALDRLKKILDEENLKVQSEDKEISVSLSSCVAEPVEHDTPEILLNNLREDLAAAMKNKGNIHGQILQYHEISPLLRYIKNEGHDSK